MNMCARFDEIPARISFKILRKQNITDGQGENSIPSTNKVLRGGMGGGGGGGIKTIFP